MELLQDPDVKSTYDKCRYKVKLWEHQFIKKNGRLPSKLDIHEANREVRNAYKTYFRLKTAALEESLMHIDGFDADTENSDQNTTQKSEKQTNHNESINAFEQSAQSNLELSSKTNTKDTWGLHLNKQAKSNMDDKSKSEKLKVNLSFSQKLFEGSKSSKRLPRKSLSFNRKKSEPDYNKSQFFSQPEYSSSFLEQPQETSESSSINLNSNLFQLDNVKIAAPNPVILSTPVNIVQNVVNNNYNNKPLRNLDTGWIQRVTQNTGTELLNSDFINSEDKFDLNHSNTNGTKCTSNLINSEISSLTNTFDAAKIDYDSDDIIANSEDEQDNSCSLYHIAKRRKTIDDTIQSDKCEEQNAGSSKTKLITVDTVPKRLDFSNIFPSNEHSKSINVNDVYNNKTKSVDDVQTNKVVNPIDVYDFQPEEKKELSKTKKKKTKTNTVKSKNQNSALRKSGRARKTVMDLPQESDNEDPFHSDNDVNDPEFEIDKNDNSRLALLDDVDSDETKRVSKAKKSTQKKSKSNNEEKQIEKESSDQTYELEYSVKPRIVTVPRIKNIKQTISKIKKQKPVEIDSDTSEPSSSQKRVNNKLQQKIESGTLNENFVQINLKKKIYVRGKSTQTYSKYKKQMWKNKKNALYGPNMDMGGCDGGMFTCFNCGQVGHFARQCKLGKSDLLLPLQDDEEECPYPTLEEAAKMAKESVLAIRKPNKVQSSDDLETTEVQVGDVSVDGNEMDNQNNDLFDEEDDEDLLAETERLEQEIAKIDVHKYVDMTTRVKPYYDVAENGNLLDTPQEVFDTLQKFGHQKFRAGQEQAVMRILSGKSTLVTLSTGSGKSLCYQLPAYLYSQREPCITLIISPLVSLMEDQVTGIPAFLKAACLHTNQTKTQRDKIMEAISMGNLNILLVSPEAVVAGERSSGFGSLLRKLPPIAFACIDEAHCVSQWSHNFRPSYLKICRVLRDRLGVNTVLGLTATATRATSDSIIEHLSIPDGRDGIISDIPLPDNLRLTVSRDVQRDQALLGLLLSDRFVDCKSIIVYCTRREECQRVATFLRTCLKHDGWVENQNKKRKRYSLQAEPYHAGMSASRRKSIQKAFMSGELRIVVATVAFGMGINKSDIRAVIHYNMPMSFESYVQEVGRAGRDGLPAHCHLFLDSRGKDENELRRHIYANSTDRHVIRKLLQRCFIPCSCKISCPRHEVAFSIQETVLALDIPEENIETLLCYLELHDKRHIELLSHAYVTCKVISYGGPNQIKKAAKECPPLAMALALYQNKNNNAKDDNIFEFPVVEVASAMGWDSGICKHKLKNLEWITEKNQPKRSKLTVQFLNLGFHLLAPGNLSDSELDEALDNLYERVKDQEQTSLLQLHAVHTTLTAVVNPTFKACVSVSEVTENEKQLKLKIREYFESPKPLELLPKIETQPVKEDQIAADVRSLVAMYRDNSFTGRAVARIFYGIQSPNYPAFIWGRCKFWRAHLGTDFNAICRIATREIIKMR